MKFKTLFIAFIILFGGKVFAEVPVIPVANAPKVTSEPKPTIPTTSFENCVKIYNTSVDNLFYLTLSALNVNNYKIDEIQSRTGYISFATSGKSFLISVTSVNSQSSMIRITPMDNSYNFSPTVVERIFTYLTNNVK